MRILLRCCLLLALLAVGLAPVPPVAAQPAAITDPRPPPGALVPGGTITVSARVGAVDAVIAAAGEPQPTTVAGGVATAVLTDVAAGPLPLTVEAGGTTRTWTVDVSGLTTTRLAGDDRIATAVTVARHRHPDGADGALLARADDFPDAVAAGVAAHAADLPLLLTWPDRLPAATAEALQTLLAPGGTVTVVGGDAAVAPAVAEAVADLGFAVERAAGDSRHATAAALAAAHLPAATAAAVVPADRWETALQTAAWAAGQGHPLLLVDHDRLPDVTAEALDAVRDVVLVGDVDAAVVTAIEELGVRVTVTGVDALTGTTEVAALATSRAFADALVGSSLGVPLALTADDGAPPPQLAAWNPATLLVLGGTAAVDDAAVAAARTAIYDSPQAPGLSAEWQDGEEVPSLRLTADRLLDGVSVHVTVAGREVVGTTAHEGATVTWTPGPAPADLPTQTPLDVTATVLATAGGAARHLTAGTTATLPPRTSVSPEGFIVAGGVSEVVGTGPLRRFTIEVQPATGLDVTAVEAIATPILLDPRGWTARGERSMQRVDDPAAAHVRVVIATPATVDAFCGRVGLGTGGRLSCWDGRRAMLNLDRWTSGVPHIPDLTQYRQYLLNHEVGHGLGYRHVGCPAAGALAPVMMQQTKYVAPCVPNGWPYPHG